MRLHASEQHVKGVHGEFTPHVGGTFNNADEMLSSLSAQVHRLSASAASGAAPIPSTAAATSGTTPSAAGFEAATS